MPDDHASDAFAYFEAAAGLMDDDTRRIALEAILSSIYGATIPGSGSYQRTTREEAPGAAFADRDFGDWQDKVRFEPETVHHVPPRPRIDRNVLARARSLKRMIASTAYEGERANAQAGLDKLMAKHNFTERDL